jgi:IS5 family transposase
VHDSQLLPDLLHGEETRVWGDSAYTGQGEVMREQAPNAKDFTHNKGSRFRPLTEVQSTRESRTSVSGAQTTFRVYQGALPRIGQERQLVVRGLRAGQPVPGTTGVVAANVGMVRL